MAQNACMVVRTFEHDRRAYRITYTMDENEDTCIISVCLSTLEEGLGEAPTTSAVSIIGLTAAQRHALFEMISGAKEPLFPVHLYDVVRDYTTMALYQPGVSTTTSAQQR